jgi:hypothetical protein
MMACHPAIYTGPETQFFGAYHPLEREYLREKDGRCGISEYLGKNAFYELLGESFWIVVSALPTPPRQPRYFLEKSPYHCAFAELILRVFPRARFVHLIRDARSVVASMLRISRTWGKNWAPDTAERATQFWFECVRAGCAISELVRSPDQYIGIRYEDVRSTPDEYLVRLYEWLELPHDRELVRSAVDANCLDKVHSTGELFPSIPMPHSDSALPKYPDGHVGPAPLRGDEADLDPHARRTVEDLAVDVLRELGYEV